MGIFADSRQAKKKANSMVNSLGIMRAQKIHTNLYGAPMSPSRLNTEMNSGILSSETKSYLKTRKQQVSKTKSQYNW